MNFSFLHIPKEYWDSIITKEHVEHKKVYRLVSNAKSITKNDFVPSNIENKDKPNAIKINQSSFSVSLTCDKMKAEEYKKRYTVLSDKEIACGFTNISRGISHNCEKRHIDYFLFDYIHNSPYADFGECYE